MFGLRKKPVVIDLRQALANLELDGIENELRGVQHLEGAIAASRWWVKSFAHKYPDFYYDIVEERIVRR